jgi:hypothetical protein
MMRASRSRGTKSAWGPPQRPPPRPPRPPRARANRMRSGRRPAPPPPPGRAQPSRTSHTRRRLMHARAPPRNGAPGGGRGGGGGEAWPHPPSPMVPPCLPRHPPAVFRTGPRIEVGCLGADVYLAGFQTSSGGRWRGKGGGPGRAAALPPSGLGQGAERTGAGRRRPWRRRRPWGRRRRLVWRAARRGGGGPAAAAAARGDAPPGSAAPPWAAFARARRRRMISQGFGCVRHTHPFIRRPDLLLPSSTPPPIWAAERSLGAHSS